MKTISRYEMMKTMEVREMMGKINQLGYIVKDIGGALDFWVNVLGVGPWAAVKDMKPDNYIYRGEPGELVMDVAVANSGELQIELIQVKSTSPNFYQEGFDKGMNGIHHVSFWQDPAHFDEVYNFLLSKGFHLAQSGEVGGPDGKFAYFDHEKYPGYIIEISKLGGPKAIMYRVLEDVCRYWDGEDPVRYFEI